MQSQLGVDTAYMADFIAGFEEAIKGLDDPRQKARMAGVTIADQVSGRMLSGLKKEAEGAPDSISDQLFYRGFTDALLNDTTVMTLSKAEPISREKIEANRQAKIAVQTAKGRAFLAENAKKEGVIVLPSGLQYKVIKQGNGPTAGMNDRVKLDYEGWLADGTVFDSSIKRNEPAVFSVSSLVPGFSEALKLMPMGSEWEIYIPQELAYGSQKAGQIMPYSALAFKIKTYEIVKE
jgi:FKBP-type peptidyl-prolyl cis-trans isomerase FklB